jgi:hypothetical protein
VLGRGGEGGKLVVLLGKAEGWGGYPLAIHREAVCLGTSHTAQGAPGPEGRTGMTDKEG